MNRRHRGLVLTLHGHKRLEAAIAAAQETEKYGKRFTQAELSERSQLDIKTIKKIRQQTAGADLNSVEALFRAFDLELEAADYGLFETDTSDVPQDERGECEPGNPTTARSYQPFKPPIGVPFQAPPLPYYFVERPEHQNAVKQLLLEDTTHHPGTLVVSAIYGLGGIGKSVLAMKLAHDPDVLARYCDGVLWATLGQQPDILAFLSHWIQGLGDHSYQLITETAASAHLRTLLADKRMLLVVDDVWDPDHAEHFRVGSSNCCVLITTREARIPQARRYPLDVMSPEQSLELITQKLTTALDKREQQQALTLAERLGYLPLALELTASQIEDGVTWTELLDDFQKEVARLETLDWYSQDDIPEDAKRRKYSLTACFQLSLKQLSPEQLRQFAWLGVVPEDATLTQDMAMTLWQVPKRAAGAILRTFSAKSLLVSGGQQSCQRASYRMHDLMHDLAQMLLISPQHPEQAGDLPGLGLTRAEAHQQLIERYREKTLDEQWHTLPDDGYIHAHLTWHLEQAEQFDQIHQLLQEETPEGRNGWYKACVALEQTANFVGDTARAWRLAKASYQESPAEAIALQCRYALIKASLNSLASNFPPKMIAALVESGQWSPAKGLAYIQRVPHPWQKLQALEELLSHIPDSLLEEALQVGQGIPDENNRLLAIIYISTRLPNLCPIAFEITDKFASPYLQFRAWGKLAINHPHLWPKALDIFFSLNNEESKANFLEELIHDIPDSLLPEVLERIEKFRKIQNRVIALGTLALRMPIALEIIEASLVEAQAISDDFERVSALASLAPMLPKLWPEIFALIKTIKQSRAQVYILERIIPHIPEEFTDEIITITESFRLSRHKAHILGAIAKRKSYLWSEALEAIQYIEDTDRRIYAISCFSKKSDALLELLVSDSQELKTDYDRAVFFSVRALLNPGLQPKALELTRCIQDVFDRARAYEYLASQVPNLSGEIIDTVQAIKGARYRVWALEELVPIVPELWPELIRSIQKLYGDFMQGYYLYRLSSEIPNSQIKKSISIANSIQSASERLCALSAFSQHSSVKNEIQEAYENYQQDLGSILDSDVYIAIFLSGYALIYPEIWPEILEKIENSKTPENKAASVKRIASRIPGFLIEKAVEVVLTVESDYYKGDSLYELIPRMEIDDLDHGKWSVFLSALSSLRRRQFLERMPFFRKTIINLASEEALIQTAYAIQDVCRQWP